MPDVVPNAIWSHVLAHEGYLRNRASGIGLAAHLRQRVGRLRVPDVIPCARTWATEINGQLRFFRILPGSQAADLLSLLLKPMLRGAFSSGLD